MKFVMDVQHLRQMSLLTFERSGQSSRSKPLYWKSSRAIDRLQFRYIHQIWHLTEVLSARNMPSNKIKMAASLGLQSPKFRMLILFVLIL